MDHKEIRTLKILEEIDSNKSVNQRTIAGNLNISLGLVNSFIKRLAKKGFIKVTTIPKNRIIYLLTPMGVTEKTRLTYNYIRLSYQFYKETRSKLFTLFDKISKKDIKKVAFFGNSEIAEIAYISLIETGIEFEGLYDIKEDGKFMGKLVKPLNKIDNKSFDTVLITDIEMNEYKYSILLKYVEKNKILELD
ncbi:MAG: winged helix-turn-helix transcriptional regulator [Deltaproteobacteria bacterium]|nr:winged helix-turn-helix transcriptional regulator [Deltaproteobacteria bacterium]